MKDIRDLLADAGRIEILTDVERILQDPPSRPCITVSVADAQRCGEIMLEHGAHRINGDIYELRGFYVVFTTSSTETASLDDLLSPYRRSGTARFLDLPITVDEGVFWPHPGAAALVFRAIEVLAGRPGKVVEVGCGTGAVGIAIALRAPDALVLCADVSPAACACARSNVTRLQAGNAEVWESDLLSGVSQLAPFDVIVGNLPWLAPVDVALGALDHHKWAGPLPSIRGIGRDGLDLLRNLLAQAVGSLRPSGYVVLQVAPWQAARLTSELSETFEFEVASNGYVLIAQPKTSAAQSAL